MELRRHKTEGHASSHGLSKDAIIRLITVLRGKCSKPRNSVSGSWQRGRANGVYTSPWCAACLESIGLPTPFVRDNEAAALRRANGVSGSGGGNGGKMIYEAP